MTKTRFTQWVVLACMGALAACTSDGGPAGNTELNVLIPSGSSQSGPGTNPFDIQIVEYTIVCDDGIDYDPTSNPDIDSGPILDNDVTLNGNLEVLNTPGGPSTDQDFGPDLDEVYVWQGFMDLPPTAGCTVQLRARDGDGEVICTSTVTFDISADTTTKVNVLMDCQISYQAPVGMLDLDADFSFNVSNYCPDLFVLNCVSEPVFQPILGVAATGCQVRFRDADSTCGQSCDPQTCSPSADGLSCTPGPDPGVSTTVTCTNDLDPLGSFISCDGANPAAECSFTGDTLGTLGFPGPSAAGLGDGGFAVACTLFDSTGDTVPDTAVTPGATVTCVAVTTDGDEDCDKEKVVELTCPGLTSCQVFLGGGGSCDDGNSCTANECNDATCDAGTGAGCCENPPLAAGTPCVTGGFGGECDGAGLCVSQDCNAQPDPTAFCQDGNVCTTNACNPDGSCSSDPNDGVACSTGTGSDAGVCGGGTCNSTDECTSGDVSGCPGSANECVVPSCDESGAPFVCDFANAPAGTPCTTVPNGACDGAGTCAAPPVIGPGGGSSVWQALPVQGSGCVYDSVTTTCSGCVSTGVTVPGGGSCDQFQSVFGGCEVPGGVLNAQLALDVIITLDASSTGDGNLTHDISIQAQSGFALQTAAALVSVDAADIFSDVSTGVPAQVTNSLDPAVAGNLLGFFTGGSPILLLDDEILPATTGVVPTSSPDVDVNFSGNFLLTLTIQASGDALVVDAASCTFDSQGAAITFPVN